MRQHRLIAVSTVLVGCATLAFATFAAQAQPATKGGNPCQQIRAACEQAGFKQGAVKEGNGLLVDCVRPIVQGTPQRPNALALPQVDSQLVDACKQRNPNFGMPKQKQEPKQEPKQ
ncbi:MAG: hypothetical protein JO000_06925 [Alphaproteobacteria bacterium]|nr:hypothetical protein [Alphaproteobacteria bacterium]